MSDQHSIRVDYTALGNHIHLKLERSQGGHASVTDRAGRLYFPPASYDTCVRYMRAFAARHPGTVLDEGSIERLGREPKAERVPAGPGRSVSESPVSQADSVVVVEPASRPSNVTPLRRHQEPHDCPPRVSPRRTPGADSTPKGA